jgi:GTP-binding protein HflX
MFERPNLGERVILVNMQVLAYPEDIKAQFAEFIVLAHSAGVKVCAQVITTRQIPDPKYLIGTGKLAEIKKIVELQEIDVVLFNQKLSPAQARNLEYALKVRVVDRTGLILDIFAQRARSYAGKLQVELAQLNYLATRLVRGWTHLERQKGGIGLRGPGEKQLETDRRLIRERIKTISKRLLKIKTQRKQINYARSKQGLPVIALVGYTNAGKSSLFNLLTGANVYVQDQLFATLDPSIRQVIFPGLGPCVVIDTVGFIQALPHHLIAAFAATLEDTVQADLLLHIIDISDTKVQQHQKQQEVSQVLEKIGAHKTPIIEVYNKIDLTNKSAFFESTSPARVGVSAQHKLG